MRGAGASWSPTNDPFRLTFVDQSVVRSMEELDVMLATWFAPETGLEKVEFAPRADALALLLDGDTAIAGGISDDRYTMRDGRSGVMPTTWSATARRGADGQWRLASLHAGVDPQDNAILDIHHRTFRMLLLVVGLACALIALLIGVVLGRRWGRR